MIITIQKIFDSIIGSSVSIKNLSSLDGGDINDVYKISSTKGQFCIKINDKNRFPNMLQKEANGLEILDQKTNFTIPKVLGHGFIDEKQYLLMSYVNSANTGRNFWTDFGVKLAEMHKVSNQKFGFFEDNFIGSLTQKNTQENSWNDFFGKHRIMHQVKLGVDRNIFDKSLIAISEKLIDQLNQLFPTEPPALLHGDLWSGNYMIDDNGDPCLIDPAVYFGHREMDIAMMHLFGGFDHRLFGAYNEVFPLEKGWKSRVQLCNLYPTLVHANLFGGHYASQSQRIISKYT